MASFMNDRKMRGVQRIQKISCMISKRLRRWLSFLMALMILLPPVKEVHPKRKAGGVRGSREMTSQMIATTTNSYSPNRKGSNRGSCLPTYGYMLAHMRLSQLLRHCMMRCKLQPRLRYWMMHQKIPSEHLQQHEGMREEHRRGTQCQLRGLPPRTHPQRRPSQFLPPRRIQFLGWASYSYPHLKNLLPYCHPPRNFTLIVMERGHLQQNSVFPNLLHLSLLYRPASLLRELLKRQYASCYGVFYRLLKLTLRCRSLPEPSIPWLRLNGLHCLATKDNCKHFLRTFVANLLKKMLFCVVLQKQKITHITKVKCGAPW